MDRGQAGILDGAGDQPGEDAGDQAEAEGNESGLSGFHVSVRSFAPRVGAASLPECDSLHQGPGSGAGEAAGVDYRAAEWRPDPPTDWGLEPSPEKLGDLFPLWLSEASFRSDQRLRAVAPLETPAASQPAALPAPERHDGLCPDEASGLDRPVIGADGAACACLRRASLREPDAGNPHVRFDEGRGNRASASVPLLLYRHPRLSVAARVAHWPPATLPGRPRVAHTCRFVACVRSPV